MADEYIRRDTALRAVTKRYGACRSPAQNRLLDEIRNEIRRAPAADVAPVVRCRDCEYVSPTVSASTGERVGIWCALHDIFNVSSDDYCSRGLRKGGNYGAVD